MILYILWNRDHLINTDTVSDPIIHCDKAESDSLWIQSNDRTFRSLSLCLSHPPSLLLIAIVLLLSVLSFLYAHHSCAHLSVSHLWRHRFKTYTLMKFIGLRWISTRNKDTSLHFQSFIAGWYSKNSSALSTMDNHLWESSSMYVALASIDDTSLDRHSIREDFFSLLTNKLITHYFSPLSPSSASNFSHHKEVYTASISHDEMKKLKKKEQRDEKKYWISVN